MHVERQQVLRDWLALSLTPMVPVASHDVDVLATAVVEDVEHRVLVDGHTVRYVVQAGDVEADIATGLAADAADLATLTDPITATPVGDVVTFARANAFVCVPEPPLETTGPGIPPPVVWQNQDAPQPDEDFVSLNEGTDRPEGREETEQGVHPVMEVTHVRSFRVQIVDILLVGEWSGVTADDLRRVLESPASVEALEPYVVRNIATILDATAPQDTMWTARVAVSVELAYTDERRVAGEAIESIEADGTVGPISMTITEP